MDPANRLFRFSQDDCPIGKYVDKFCGLCYGVDFDDDVLKDMDLTYRTNRKYNYSHITNFIV